MTTFLTSVFSGAAQGAVYALLGLGFVIIYRGTGVINFAQPTLMMFGGYLTSYFVTVQGLPFWVGLVCGMIATAAVGAAVERVALRPMVGEPAFSAAMVTIGVFFALQIIVNDLIGLDLRHMGDPWGLGTITVGGVRMFHADIAKLAVTAVLVTALLAFLKYSRVGLAMRATAFDQEVALAQGIPVGLMFGLSWALSGALAAVAGMFVGVLGVGIGVTTTFIALKALPAIILGGLDSVGGAVVGGLVIGIAEALVKTYQPQYFAWAGANVDQAVPYVIMFLVLLVRPYGLFGTPEVERV